MEEVVMAVEAEPCGDVAGGKNGVMWWRRSGGGRRPPGASLDTLINSSYLPRLVLQILMLCGPTPSPLVEASSPYLSLSFPLPHSREMMFQRDRVSFDVRVGDDCTAAIKTQSSTKVYKAIGTKCSEQILEVVLEDSMDSTVAERMHNYQITAMLILVGPKLIHIQTHIRNDVKETMSQLFQLPFDSEVAPTRGRNHSTQLENRTLLLHAVASVIRTLVWLFESWQ